MNVDYNNKNLLIWGYGREGKSTESFLKNHFSPNSVEIYEGSLEGINQEKYDYIFKSPGIPLLNYKTGKITSQTEVFLREFRDRTVGITGTKGKSTTSAMTARCLGDNLPNKVLLLGNIGKPCLDYYDELKADKNAIPIFELSCHQLSTCCISPHVAVFLNIHQEHLDYYGNFCNYIRAKENIARYQIKRDVFYKGNDIDICSPGKNIAVDYEEIIEKNSYDLSVKGVHNQFNSEIAFRIATEQFGVDKEKAKESLEKYGGLPHRLELVESRGGLYFYDDSISTIPEASISAVESIENAKTLLVGGMDRGIDYEILINYVKRRTDINFIFMYESGHRIAAGLPESMPNVFCTPGLEEAVKKAIEITKEGAVILSPAAPSYGYFKDFAHRGDVFKELVAAIMK